MAGVASVGEQVARLRAADEGERHAAVQGARQIEPLELVSGDTTSFKLMVMASMGMDENQVRSVALRALARAPTNHGR